MIPAASPENHRQRWSQRVDNRLGVPMWRTVRSLVIFFVIGETNRRYWAVSLAILLALVGPAFVFGAAGLSAPLLVRLVYGLAIAAVAGVYAAPAGWSIWIQLAGSASVVLFVLTFDAYAHLWQVMLVFLSAYGAFGAGLVFGLRERRAHLADELEEG